MFPSQKHYVENHARRVIKHGNLAALNRNEYKYAPNNNLNLKILLLKIPYNSPENSNKVDAIKIFEYLLGLSLMNLLKASR